MEAMRAFAAELRREKATARQSEAQGAAKQTEDAGAPAISREELGAKLAEAAPQVRDLLKSFVVELNEEASDNLVASVSSHEEAASQQSDDAATPVATPTCEEPAGEDHDAPDELEAIEQPTNAETLLQTPPEVAEQPEPREAPSPAPVVVPDIITEHADDDAAWVAANLRCDNGKPYRDIANVVRILMTHPDFAGRFWFNKAMVKVVDRGAIMLDWQIDALAADLQERFLPEISESIVGSAVVIAANRTDRFAK
jgi:hypothetical protein